MNIKDLYINQWPRYNMLDTPPIDLHYGYDIDNYPDWGSYNLNATTHEALEHAIRGVFHSHYGIPENMIKVDMVSERPEFIMVIRYNRGDKEFYIEVYHSSYNRYDLPTRIDDAIKQIIQRALSTPVEYKKLDEIKSNLKEYHDWLKDEAEDEEFINVFLEYFEEDIK